MAILYRHIRLDKNQPFYIGIGSNIKRAYNKFHRNNIWNKITKKSTYEVEILLYDLSWEQAQEKEKEFIALYGRIEDGGILCNMTQGGDGTLGYKISDATKLKISNKQKVRLTDKTKHPMYSKKHSLESIKKNRESNLGSKSFFYGKKGALHPRFNKPISNEQKIIISQNNKKRKKITFSILNEIIKLSKEKSIVEISKIYGVSHSTIYRNIKKYKNEIYNGG